MTMKEILTEYNQTPMLWRGPEGWIDQPVTQQQWSGTKLCPVIIASTASLAASGWLVL